MRLSPELQPILLGDVRLPSKPSVVAATQFCAWIATQLTEWFSGRQFGPVEHFNGVFSRKTGILHDMLGQELVLTGDYWPAKRLLNSLAYEEMLDARSRIAAQATSGNSGGAA